MAFWLWSVEVVFGQMVTEAFTFSDI